jgi:glycosyltransferase involved in cell wall biosynthesis
MKLCLITSEFPPVIGGIASHVFELARALSAKGETVTVVHPVAPGTTQSGTESYNFKVLRPEIMRSKPFYDFALHRYLKKLQREQKFDLIHVHGVRPLSATKGLGLPVVFTNHSSGFLARHHAGFIRKWRTRRLLAHVDALIGPSDELVESAQFFGYRCPARMIANGVDAERFTPGTGTRRNAWHIGADDTVILLARRLVFKNGVVGFAEAVAQMSATNFRIVIAGDGPDRATMTEIFDKAGRLDRCLFLGRISNTDMPDIFRSADVSVLPSLAEATSIAGLEAMASGLPLVGTNVGGIPTIIADGVTGLIVPPRDPIALAQALDRLCADKERRKKMGDAARARVEAEFSWPKITDDTRHVYDACLKNY